MANMPEKKFRAGPVVATVWLNKSDDGKNEFRTVSFERTYKDKNDEWQTTNNLRISDLPRAVLLLNKAYEEMSLGQA